MNIIATDILTGNEYHSYRYKSTHNEELHVYQPIINIIATDISKCDEYHSYRYIYR